MIIGFRIKYGQSMGHFRAINRFEIFGKKIQLKPNKIYIEIYWKNQTYAFVDRS